MSFYGPGLYGRRTACGQALRRTTLGVAHRTLPCGTRVELRNPKTGETVTVRVIDRGPYIAGRMWDLTSATCRAIRMCFTGTIQFRLPGR
jgi:rare lipoprotein A